MTDQEQITQIDAALAVLNPMWIANRSAAVGHTRGMFQEMRADIINGEKAKRHDIDFAETMAFFHTIAA